MVLLLKSNTTEPGVLQFSKQNCEDDEIPVFLLGFEVLVVYQSIIILNSKTVKNIYI